MFTFPLGCDRYSWAVEVEAIVVASIVEKKKNRTKRIVTPRRSVTKDIRNFTGYV